MRSIVLLLLAGLAFAGCAEDRDRGGDDTSGAAIGYDGTGSVDRTDTAACGDGQAQLTGAGSIDEGQVTVVLRDGQGREVLRETFDDRIEMEAEALQGADGQWTVHADGSDTFDGVYAFNLLCT